MSDTATTSPNASLQYAFIFDRRLGAEDEAAGELEKLEQVLYFWPPQTTAFQQIVRISLCSGVLDFCRSFSGGAAVDGVQMEDQYYTFHECEPDIWMVWVVRNPRKLEFGGRRGPALSKTKHMRNIFQPTTLREQLRGMHAIYRLFHGSLRAAIAPGGDLSIMQVLMAKRRALRKALEMKEKLDEGAVSSTEANLARAALVPGLEAELRVMEATSTVTRVRRQLRQVVAQFLGDDFTQRWDHHAFRYQTAVSRCAVERFTYLSVQYFTSTVKTGLHGIVQNLMVFDDHDLIWSDYDQRVQDLICAALQAPAMARAWSQCERMSFPFLPESNGHVMARRIFLDQSEDELPPSSPSSSPSSCGGGARGHPRRAGRREQILLVYYQAPITICLGVNPLAWNTQWGAGGGGASTDGGSASGSPAARGSARQANGGGGYSSAPPAAASSAQTSSSSSSAAAAAAAVAPAHADLFNPPLCGRIAALIKPELRKLSKLIERNKKAVGEGEAASGAAQGVRYLVKNLNNNRVTMHGFDRGGRGGGGRRGDTTIRSFGAMASIAPQLSPETLYLLDNALRQLAPDRPRISTHILKNSSRQWVVSAQSGERQLFLVFDAEAELLSLVEASALLTEIVNSAFSNFYLL